MRSLNPLTFQFYRTRFFQLKETIAGNSHFLREEKQNNSKETNKKQSIAQKRSISHQFSLSESVLGKTVLSEMLFC